MGAFECISDPLNASGSRYYETLEDFVLQGFFRFYWNRAVTSPKSKIALSTCRSSELIDSLFPKEPFNFNSFIKTVVAYFNESNFTKTSGSFLFQSFSE
jgi:hypothetical protein